MMLAAARYGEGEGDPPPELVLAQDCEDWHCLPREGGYLDQPAGLMRRIKIFKNITIAFRDMHNAEDKVKWQEENPLQWKLVQDVWKMKDEK